MAAESQLSLYYFEGKRGLAEKIRMLFAETGLKYTEVPVDKSKFELMKADGSLNYGTLPALKDGSMWIEQSANIIEYVARIADQQKRGPNGNLYCGNPEEIGPLRSISYATTDFQVAAKLFLGKAATPEGFLADTLPKYFAQIQKLLEKNDDGVVSTDEWCFGKNFTFADVTVFEAVNAVANVHGIGKLRPYPKVKEFHDKVAGRKSIEKYIVSRPDGC